MLSLLLDLAKPLYSRRPRGYVGILQSCAGVEQQHAVRRLQIALLQQMIVRRPREKAVHRIARNSRYQSEPTVIPASRRGAQLPVSSVVSMGRRHTFLKFNRRRLKTQSLSWALI